MRNYVVIGGSSGIGKELVQILAEKGHQVFATYNENPQQDTPKLFYQKFNVLEDDLQMQDFPEEIHGIAYCPGSIQLKPFHRFKEEDLLQDYRLQVLGAVKVIQQLLPKLKRAESASIVLFSTIAVQYGFNFHSQVSMSKGAVEGLCKALAAELAPKIRVNTIAPSLTQTPLADRLLNSPEKIELQAAKNPLKKVGDPKEIAQTAAFLLSSESAWTTGQILHVDGGYSTLKL